jgi:hypothetical protein
MMVGTLVPRASVCVCEARAAVKVRGIPFSFALDLKSEIKQELFCKNDLSILLEKLVGTGSIKISRTVLPGWDPD